MNRIEIEVLGSQAALAAFTRAWRQQRPIKRGRSSSARSVTRARARSPT